VESRGFEAQPLRRAHVVTMVAAFEDDLDIVTGRAILISDEMLSDFAESKVGVIRRRGIILVPYDGEVALPCNNLRDLSVGLSGKVTARNGDRRHTTSLLATYGFGVFLIGLPAWK